MSESEEEIIEREAPIIKKKSYHVEPREKQAVLEKLIKFISTSHLHNIISVVIVFISVGTLLFIGFTECQECFKNLNKPKSAAPVVIQEARKTFFAYGRNIESGYLKTVFLVLDRLGYNNDPEDPDWDLLWAHDYPFRTLYPKLKNLKPHQRVNHFPGNGYIVQKVELATSGLKYIPPAFKLPNDKEKLLQYIDKNPDATFVQKDNNHRDIQIKTDVKSLDLDKEGTFIQLFVEKPLLVNGHKFDIGIYTIITSIDPLRVYIYNAEALLRFCPVKYYPFDPANIDKYVVGDDYIPPWDIPDIQIYYKNLGFSMKESLNAHLRSQGKEPSVIWEQIENAIRIVTLSKEAEIMEVVKKFPSKRNFFEMMRFDFIVDEDLNVYLMEANMSPNLSASHFPPNQLMFEQIVFNLFGLVGIGQRIYKDSLRIRSKAEEEMQSSDKHITVFPHDCQSSLCQNTCAPPQCQLCKQCLAPETRDYLLQAYREHVNKGDCKRIFPPVMTPETAKQSINLDEYSPENQLMYRWFQGKCLLDKTWCS